VADPADTIVALATAPGESAVGIVRVSGAGALAAVAPLVRAAVPLEEFACRVVRRVSVVDPRTGDRLDDALCTVMRGPRSYTGEDTVELSCHGSPALLRLVVERVLAGGARVARPGEFTRRAFVNGRIDLAQAEAVSLLIGARTDRAVVLSARAMAGGIATDLAASRDRLLDLIARLEVVLDFPDDGFTEDWGDCRKALDWLHEDAARHLGRARAGRIVHEGITVGIVGPPNAGKSSLFNALLGRERSIVSPHAGTTRDVVEAVISLAGVPVRLLDTAGLGEPRDEVDALGMDRSRAAIEESDVLLVVLDGSVEVDRRVVGATANRPRLVALAKSDLDRDPSAAALSEGIAVSVRAPGGLDELARRLLGEVERRAGLHGEEGAAVASLRQLEVLESLEQALRSARKSLGQIPLEATLVDLNDALGIFALLLGDDVSDAVLDRVFSRFCVGK
jgi:tRNA modification GTPase